MASRDLRECIASVTWNTAVTISSKEYFRDLKAVGRTDIFQRIISKTMMSMRHRLMLEFSRGLFFNNWINYAVYQETPFDWENPENDALFCLFIRGTMTYLSAFEQGNLVLPSALYFHFQEIFSSSEDFLVWQFFICRIQQH